MSLRKLAGLTCEVADAPGATAAPTLAVVLCHGFGAPATDLVPLGRELLRGDDRLTGVRFYFPAAPLDLGPRGMPGGRAWWWLDLDRLVMAAEAGRLRDLRTEVPVGLDAARDALLGLIKAVCDETGLPLARVVLGGFSQGAMLSTDVALRLPEPVAALCAFSGTVCAEAEWIEAAKRQKPLRALVSHGRQDPILPFYGAEALRDLLTEHGHSVEFIPFDGGHTVPWPALRSFAAMLAELNGTAAE